jgi:threonine/homoserine/homoserine lactone efflux protein
VRALIAAFERYDTAAARLRVTPLHAFTHGILLTMASVNEVVFWTAVMALGTGAVAAPGGRPDLGFAAALILGVVSIAFAVESALACLVTTRGIADRISRLRRPLEPALGAAFGATGIALLGFS